MELRKLNLKDGEQIKIGADCELSITITRYGDKLKIQGPAYSETSTAIMSREGLKLTRGI